MITFLGIHLGRASFGARLLTDSGREIDRAERRFRGHTELEHALAELVESWVARGSPHSVVIGLEKGHRSSLALHQLKAKLAAEVALLTVPATLSVLLGALPSGPGMLLSMGSNLRIATVDSSHSFRELRMQEGGGQWWSMELSKLAQHSPRLSQAMAQHRSGPQLMKAVPRLLETGDYPSPDPVLKARLDKLGQSVAESCLNVASRLPGVRRLVLSGYLHPSPMSRRVLEACEGTLDLPQPRFPAEVGAALLGLALYKENQERLHLGKPPETGQFPATDWGASPVLLRRLFRLRKPFPEFFHESAS